MTPRRSRFVLLVIVMSALLLGPFAAGPLWRFVSAKRIYVEGIAGRAPVRGYSFVKRWAKPPTGSDSVRHGRQVSWYVDTGFKRRSGNYRDNELFGVETIWHPNGTLLFQMRPNPGAEDGIEFREHEPWWDGASDQTVPSMPGWMGDDREWQAALDAQDR